MAQPPPKPSFTATYSLFPAILGWIVIGPGLGSVITARPWAHLNRSALGLSAMTLNFFAISMLPVAELTTINFLAPLAATALAAILLGDRVGLHRWAAIALGFSGIIVMTQPGSRTDLPALGLLLSFMAVGLMSYVPITLRQLGSIDPPTTTVFWFTASGTAIGLVALIFCFQPHDLLTWAMIVGMGVSGALLQLMMTMSLQLAPVSASASLDYLQILWATLLSWLVWGNLPSVHTVVGGMMICAAGLYTVYREQRRHKSYAAQGTPTS
jgi:drug/metabolite transporter (DMT)-like permease